MNRYLTSFVRRPFGWDSSPDLHKAGFSLVIPSPQAQTLHSVSPISWPRRSVKVIPNPTSKSTTRVFPGDTVSGGIRRLERDVLSRNPDLVFIEFGWNDFKDGVESEEFDAGLRNLVEEVQIGAGSLVYLMTTTHVDVALANWKIKKRNEIIREIANDLDCGLIDLYLHFSLARQNGNSLDDLMSSDNIHPSGAGQEVIAKAVIREFLP